MRFRYVDGLGIRGGFSWIFVIGRVPIHIDRVDQKQHATFAAGSFSRGNRLDRESGRIRAIRVGTTAGIRFRFAHVARRGDCRFPS